MSDPEDNLPIKSKKNRSRQINHRSTKINTSNQKLEHSQQSTTNLPVKPKLTDYRCFHLEDIKSVYISLLNDNLQYLINYIYENADKEPYKNPATRVALSMQMILSSDQLIPYQTASMIAKDIEELRRNEEYTNQWVNPTLKRKALSKELEMLKKHTEIDETMSLNLTDNPHEDNYNPNLRDFDIHSGISTLNVSSQFPVANEIDNSQGSGCMVM
jgi:hypothetical protein